MVDWDNSLIHCPNGISLPFHEGDVVRFPKHECLACPLRSQCTTSKNGRTISIHPDESNNFGFWILDFGLKERLIGSPTTTGSLFDDLLLFFPNLKSKI